MSKFEKSDVTPMNWNAGAEFNDLISMNKQSFNLATIENKPFICLDILSNDLDLSFKKIELEAYKLKKDVRPALDSLRKDVINLYATGNKFLNNNRLDLLKIEITKVKRKLWDLQGEFGVLFPIDGLKSSWEDSVMEEYDINEKDLQTP